MVFSFGLSLPLRQPRRGVSRAARHLAQGRTVHIEPQTLYTVSVINPLENLPP
jgi:hypothetical protein